MNNDSQPEERTFTPDRPLIPQMVDEIMNALNAHPEAAYRVYLKLSTQYGCMQKIC